MFRNLKIKPLCSLERTAVIIFLFFKNYIKLGLSKSKVESILKVIKLPTSYLNLKISGGYRGGETPVPIPNTAVKPSSANGTRGVSPRESRSPPENYFYQASLFAGRPDIMYRPVVMLRLFNLSLHCLVCYDGTD